MTAYYEDACTYGHIGHNFPDNVSMCYEMVIRHFYDILRAESKLFADVSTIR